MFVKYITGFSPRGIMCGIMDHIITILLKNEETRKDSLGFFGLFLSYRDPALLRGDHRDS